MNNDINLLVKNQQAEHEGSKGLRLLRKISLVSLAGVLLSSFLLFLLTVLSPLPRLQQEEQSVQNDLSKYHTGMYKLAIINDRVKNISGVVSDRKHFDKNIEVIKEQVPEGGTIDSVKMSDKNMSFGILSDSLEPLDKFLQNLDGLNQHKKLFKTILLSSLFYNIQSGKYSLLVDMTMK
jgi:Tfp pilus assembly protein PilN